ncbi:MAG: Holliday junction resolvase [Desulfurococcales archaeon ex4484_58]|nr:MAG: Holliday junction resolvase [Desulfurococcales archaeon ex4484_58]
MRGNIRSKGFAHERDLVVKLWNHGFAVIRAPASGSKAKRTKYPDIVAIMDREVLAIEVKTINSERTIYIDRYQVDKLREFSRRAGGKAYIAVKIVGTGKWRFIPIEELEETRNKNYKVTIEKLRRGLKIQDLISMIKKTAKIDQYLNE